METYCMVLGTLGLIFAVIDARTVDQLKRCLNGVADSLSLILLSFIHLRVSLRRPCVHLLRCLQKYFYARKRSMCGQLDWNTDLKSEGRSFHQRGGRTDSRREREVQTRRGGGAKRPEVAEQRETAEGLVNPAPIVFGDIGQNVTIHSRIKEILSYYTRISWYRLRPSGKVERLAYFSSYTTKRDRYSGELPKGSDTVYLNFSSATIADSGRYFSVAGTALSLTPGSYSVLAITDSKSLPVMRVFLNRTGAVVCELKGGDPTWSDPQWEIDDAKDKLMLQAETFIDEHGAFIRSSIISLKDGIRALNCVCRHSTGVIIRTRVMQDMQGSVPASGKDQCQLLLYLSSLAVVLLLVTVTASGLWAWRRRKQSPIAQGMDSTYGI